jgi:hypothetical protein
MTGFARIWALSVNEGMWNAACPSMDGEKLSQGVPMRTRAMLFRTESHDRRLVGADRRADDHGAGTAGVVCPGRDAFGAGFEDQRLGERRDARHDDRMDGRAFIEPGGHGPRMVMAPAWIARRRSVAVDE